MLPSVEGTKPRSRNHCPATHISCRCSDSGFCVPGAMEQPCKPAPQEFRHNTTSRGEGKKKKYRKTSGSHDYQTGTGKSGVNRADPLRVEAAQG
jgi:hypothetical protein